MALKSFGSRSFGALAFGALTLAGLSSVPSSTPEIPSYGGGGGSYHTVAVRTHQNKAKVDNHEAQIIAMLHADDDVMLQLIMQIVTQEILT